MFPLEVLASLSTALDPSLCLYVSTPSHASSLLSIFRFLPLGKQLVLFRAQSPGGIPMRLLPYLFIHWLECRGGVRFHRVALHVPLSLGVCLAPVSRLRLWAEFVLQQRMQVTQRDREGGKYDQQREDC